MAPAYASWRCKSSKKPLNYAVHPFLPLTQFFVLSLSLSLSLMHSITEANYLFFCVACRYTDIKSVSIVGGKILRIKPLRYAKVQLIGPEPQAISRDCSSEVIFVLKWCNYIVLDEADRMIDMGFEPQVVAIFESMRDGSLKSDKTKRGSQQTRNNFIFDNTMPPAVKNLAQKYLRHPAIIKIGDRILEEEQAYHTEVVMCSRGR